MRIFEQECAETIISTQKEVQSQNIDAMLSEEVQSHQAGGSRKESSKLASRDFLAQKSQTSQVKAIKYVTNQLLDKDGQLLIEHQTAKSRTNPPSNAIQIVPKAEGSALYSVQSPHETGTSRHTVATGGGQNNHQAVGSKNGGIESSTFSQGSSQQRGATAPQHWLAKHQQVAGRNGGGGPIVTKPKQLFVKQMNSPTSHSNQL